MRKLLLTLALSVLAQTLFAQGAPPQGAANQPYTLEYYYKVQWGHQQEFLQALPEKPLPATAEDCRERPHDLGED